MPTMRASSWIDVAGRSAAWRVFASTQLRNELQKALGDLGIQTGIHYPILIHLQEAYRDLGYAEGAFPVTERLAHEILSLPMFPELSEEQIERVVEAVASLHTTAAT